MTIGIDISQLVYEDTGVSNYLYNLVSSLLENDKENKYVLFGSSFREVGKLNDLIRKFKGNNVEFKIFRIPPILLDYIWNRLHIFSIERLTGNIDIFITSDWVEPPSKAKKATILYDLIVYKNPKETHEKIIAVQKRKLNWVNEESDIIFCISEATKNDAKEILGISEHKLKVLYPGA